MKQSEMFASKKVIAKRNICTLARDRVQKFVRLLTIKIDMDSNTLVHVFFSFAICIYTVYIVISEGRFRSNYLTVHIDNFRIN